MDGTVSVERIDSATEFKLGFKTLCKTIANETLRQNSFVSYPSRPQSQG
jgi:hypothetical protein